jgi:hypothetical protein
VEWNDMRRNGMECNGTVWNRMGWNQTINRISDRLQN